MDKERIIEVIAEWAESEPLIRKAYLYGSHARGTPGASSDVDVAIQLNPHPGDKIERAGWVFEEPALTSSLQLLLPHTLHLEWYDPQETEIVHKGISESGILIYDQDATAVTP